MHRYFKLPMAIVLLGCWNSLLAQGDSHSLSFVQHFMDSTRWLQQQGYVPDHAQSPSMVRASTQLLSAPTSNKSQLKWSRLVAASLTLAAANYAVYQPFKAAWWQEERTHFHFYQGWRRSQGYLDFGWHDTLYGHMDKLGHFYSSRLLAEQFYDICRWIGFSENSSKILGPTVSSLLMLEIEIYDGFFKEWGFSLADFTANELGAFSPLIEEKFPVLQNFQLKFSYHPSRQPQREQTFIKDYAGMTFWLSANVHAALPHPMNSVYPKWLNLALGYSVSKPTRGQIELYLAPDINWLKIPWGGDSRTMRFIKRTLNYVHLPCFAWQLRPDRKFLPLYF
ncbi:MAG: YfiM family protein [candidate division KSB1 bacterium]|nr:YfiM family protein [candidate division KSB1 bacterium]MDZ7341804.1 YfiM family protein [candidate division KSB1 bacterium]